jgi:heat shock protein HslJ
MHEGHDRPSCGPRWPPGCHHRFVANRTSVAKLTVALIWVLLLGAGCEISSSEQPDLDGTTWSLTSWAEPDPIPAGATITAEFPDGRVAGSAGVNRYSAAVTSGTDGSFSIDPAVTTRMAGPADAMAAETAYLERLQAATSYSVDGDTLVINDSDGESSLIFTRA